MATIAEHEVVLALLREEHERGTERGRLAAAVGERMRTLAEETLETLDDEALWTKDVPCLPSEAQVRAHRRDHALDEED